MILAAYGCDYWNPERNHSWESDGWDSNYFGPDFNDHNHTQLISYHLINNTHVHTYVRTYAHYAVSLWALQLAKFTIIM